MSAVLRATPNSSTNFQHQTLVIAASKKGIDLHELRKMVGGSLRRLSAADCSAWITRLSGRGLPNPPGAAPPIYSRRRRPAPTAYGLQPTVSPPRMIQVSHIEQIGALMLRYFGGNPAAASAWFKKNWKCAEPCELGTTKRAGQVIAALKRMLARKDQSRERERPDNQNRDRNGAAP